MMGKEKGLFSFSSAGQNITLDVVKQSFEI